MDPVQPSDIENWIEELRILRDQCRCRGPLFLKPFHFSTLAHVLRRDRTTELNLPEKIRRYAHTMRLYDAFEIESPFGPFNLNPAGRYHPLELLREEAMVEPIAKALLELFKPVCADPNTLDAVNIMLRELLGDCHAHSEVTDGLFGVVCAQVWKAGRRAQIAIADSGIGIRSSLMGNPLLLDRLKSKNSCEMATVYGITSKPGRGHSGYGLAVARGLMEQNRGVLYVRSGNEAFHLSGLRTSSSRTPGHWNGTLLVIEWDLDRPMDISRSTVGSHFLKEWKMTISTFNVDIDSVATELTTRPVGAKAREELLRFLEEYSSIEIDFHNKSLTPSFADECIGQLAATIGLNDFKSRVRLTNVDEASRPLIKHVILTRCSAVRN